MASALPSLAQLKELVNTLKLALGAVADALPPLAGRVRAGRAEAAQGAQEARAALQVLGDALVDSAQETKAFLAKALAEGDCEALVRLAPQLAAATNETKRARAAALELLGCADFDEARVRTAYEEACARAAALEASDAELAELEELLDVPPGFAPLGVAQAAAANPTGAHKAVTLPKGVVVPFHKGGRIEAQRNGQPLVGTIVQWYENAIDVLFDDGQKVTFQDTKDFRTTEVRLPKNVYIMHTGKLPVKYRVYVSKDGKRMYKDNIETVQEALAVRDAFKASSDDEADLPDEPAAKHARKQNCPKRVGQASSRC